jgi:hypothetical protein
MCVLKKNWLKKMRYEDEEDKVCYKWIMLQCGDYNITNPLDHHGTTTRCCYKWIMLQCGDYNITNGLCYNYTNKRPTLVSPKLLFFCSKICETNDEKMSV